jgi:hypothetical protein
MFFRISLLEADPMIFFPFTETDFLSNPNQIQILEEEVLRG